MEKTKPSGRKKIERKDLMTSNTNLARMYGLPKVHKEN